MSEPVSCARSLARISAKVSSRFVSFSYFSLAATPLPLPRRRRRRRLSPEPRREDTSDASDAERRIDRRLRAARSHGRNERALNCAPDSLARSLGSRAQVSLSGRLRNAAYNARAEAQADRCDPIRCDAMRRMHLSAASSDQVRRNSMGATLGIVYRSENARNLTSFARAAKNKSLGLVHCVVGASAARVRAKTDF